MLPVTVGISIPTKGLVALQASDGDSRFTKVQNRIAQNKVVQKALRPVPSWGSSRVLMGGASAVIAALAVTGIVALSTTGSTDQKVRDAAATTHPKPHYLLPIAALVQQGAVPPPTLSGDNGTVGVPTGTAPRPTTPQKINPNNSDISTYRGSTGTMTPAGIATLALERGCSTAQAPIATAVAMAESGGSPSAQGDITLMTPVWDWSAGLWQIRGLRSERGTGGLRDSIANQRAATNSAAMYVVSSGCTNWSPWTTYTRGLYLGYLGVARQAVNYVAAYYKAHGHYPPVAAPDPTAVIPVSTGGGQAAAAGQTGGNTPVAKPAHPAKAAPKASSGARPSTAAGPARGTSKAGTPAKPRTSAASTPPKKALPTKTPSLPLPTKILPTKILPTNILPKCVFPLAPPLCHN
jgi:hypothetical protein